MCECVYLCASIKRQKSEAATKGWTGKRFLCISSLYWQSHLIRIIDCVSKLALHTLLSFGAYLYPASFELSWLGGEYVTVAGNLNVERVTEITEI